MLRLKMPHDHSCQGVRHISPRCWCAWLAVHLKLLCLVWNLVFAACFSHGVARGGWGGSVCWLWPPCSCHMLTTLPPDVSSLTMG